MQGAPHWRGLWDHSGTRAPHGPAVPPSAGRPRPDSPPPPSGGGGSSSGPRTRPASRPRAVWPERGRGRCRRLTGCAVETGVYGKLGGRRAGFEQNQHYKLLMVAITVKN